MTYEQCFSFDNLLKAHKKCRKSKTHKKEVIVFELNLGENLTKLSRELLVGTYQISSYRRFKVYDPKERIIEALPYKDRLVQMALCDGIIAPKLEKKLIFDNAACRKNKGTHFALKRLSSFLHKFYINNKSNKGYCLKIDIKKFFASVNNSILIEKLKNCGFESRELALICKFIGSSEKGLSLGNQTSQWFALLYLDEIDRLIKEKLRIKFYVRYMDDLILIDADKDRLRNCLKIVKNVCACNLKLELNKKTQIYPLQTGIDFLGFNFSLLFSGKLNIKLRQSAKKRIKNKFKLYKKLAAHKIVDNNYITIRINSYSAHAKITSLSSFINEQISKLKLIQ